MTNPSTPDHSETNPRDPKGSAGATLNPTRDHVQGEPEGGDKAASPAPSTPTPPPSYPPVQPPHEDKTHHDDKAHAGKSNHKAR